MRKGRKALRTSARRPRARATATEAIAPTVLELLARRNWPALEAHVRRNAKCLRMDPTRMLATTVIRPLSRVAETCTDPAEIAQYCVWASVVQALADAGLPLHEAVEILRVSTEHPQAVAAYDGILGVWDQRRLH